MSVLFFAVFFQYQIYLLSEHIYVSQPASQYFTVETSIQIMLDNPKFSNLTALTSFTDLRKRDTFNYFDSFLVLLKIQNIGNKKKF